MKLQPSIPTLRLPPHLRLSPAPGITQKLGQYDDGRHVIACILLFLYGLGVIAAGVNVHRHYEAQKAEVTVP